ncbi:hypothetical protein N431DRAFT_560073 [Stipitochalara longipes BDJ]|nr:hypothetical protein N431DRAFT_560073 [Stipitochalara longipes BDJ]
MTLFKYFKKSNNLLLFALWAFTWATANAQAVDPDIVNFKTIAIWDDLKACLTNNIFGGYYSGIWVTMGCQTNACFCRADTLGAAVNSVSVAAFSDCSDFQDQSTAVSVLTAYCAAKGYTSIITPTILQSTGACTITAGLAATKTQYVTAYVTVYASNSVRAAQLSRGMEVDSSLAVEAVNSPGDSQQSTTQAKAAPSSTSTLQPASSTSFTTNSIQRDPSLTTSLSLAASTVRTSSGTTTSSSNPPTPGPSSPSPAGQALSKPELIGIVVGIASLFVAVIGVYFTWRQLQHASGSTGGCC